MIDCRLCLHWVDQDLREMKVEDPSRLFYGCEIYGNITRWPESCPDYKKTQHPFGLCATCTQVVPRVCLSLGECVNCTDTDLYCVDQCHGGELRTSCTHWNRLKREGVHLIHQGMVFDLFPQDPIKKT
ncbi:MAG: hypothetical protein HY652_03575 [Acidobacteria bacterium]|nr:hypothetical protein [Acidobacteriota bacterium]